VLQKNNRKVSSLIFINPLIAMRQMLAQRACDAVLRWTFVQRFTIWQAQQMLRMRSPARTDDQRVKLLLKPGAWGAQISAAGTVPGFPA
jgi:hypothetical protein